MPKIKSPKMKKSITNLFFIATLGFLLLTPALLHAQTINTGGRYSSYWQINLSGGTSLFFGDLKQTRFLPISTNNNEWRTGGGLMVTKQFTPVFGLRGQGLYGQLAGTLRAANQYFENDYIEFNLNTTLSLTNLFWKYNPTRCCNVYLLAGVGLLNYNTTVYDFRTSIMIAQEGNGYGHGIGGRTLEGMVMGGIGIDFRLNDRWNINLETASKAVNSDMMDHMKGGFKYDTYNYTSVGISYKFGGNKKSKGERVPEQVMLRKNIVNESLITPQTQPVNKPVTQQPEISVQTHPVQPPVAKKIQEVKKTESTQKTIQQLQQPVKKPQYGQPARPRLEYRVQIRAHYGSAISTTYLSNKYHIERWKIREDKHNGYYIYTMGSYDTYEQARTARDSIRRSYKISDAFVVAFKNGYRLDKLPK